MASKSPGGNGKSQVKGVDEPWTCSCDQHQMDKVKKDKQG